MVTLAPDAVGRARALAQRRMDASAGLNHEKYQAKTLPQMWYDACAAFGEFAVAQFLELPEPEGVNTWHGPDVGDRIQVRSLGIPEGPSPDQKRLIVRPNDWSHHIFVLVHVLNLKSSEAERHVRVIGFLEGAQAKRERYWRDDAWFVPRSALVDPARLASYVRPMHASEINWSIRWH